MEARHDEVLTLHNSKWRFMKTQTLENYSRSKLDAFMIDCYGFDEATLAEWETKADLCADIRSFGHEQECLTYLN